MTDELKPCPFETILLTRGKRGKVSPEDYDELSQYEWYASKTKSGYYAIRTYEEHGIKKFVYMHRYIAKATEGEVDHINGDTLDNRRSNLRECTHAQNVANQKPQVGRSSRYKGVYLDKKLGTWRVQIKSTQRVKTVRTIHGIESEEIAAMIYDLLALDRFKEFARFNFPDRLWNKRHCDQCKIYKGFVESIEEKVDRVLVNLNYELKTDRDTDEQ